MACVQDTDRGEAPRFQKLPTTIKRQSMQYFRSRHPQNKRTDDCMSLPLAKKQYLRDEYSNAN